MKTRNKWRLSTTDHIGRIPRDRWPDGMNLLYIHPAQLRTEAGEGTLEQEISEKR